MIDLHLQELKILSTTSRESAWLNFPHPLLPPGLWIFKGLATTQMKMSKPWWGSIRQIIFKTTRKAVIRTPTQIFSNKERQ